MKSIELLQGDLFDHVPTLEDNSIDLVLTDFPYNIAFQNLSFDSVEDDFFYRVGKTLISKMKPGSFLVTTFTPRQDQLWRVLMSLEKAGFKTKFSPLFWVVHTGFPKSLDVSKSFERKGNVEMAKEWAGWKSYSLKPSVEIIITVQKPMDQKTITEQLLSNDHGAINAQGVRIPYSSLKDYQDTQLSFLNLDDGFHEEDASTEGRFPSNLLVSGNPLKGDFTTSNRVMVSNKGSIFGSGNEEVHERGHNDSGSPNRFYSLDRWAEKNNITLTDDSALLDVPKPAASEKEMQIDNSDVYNGKFPSSKADKGSDYKHPTSKPVTLYSYLLKMFSKPDWVVLDPCMGGGTTGIACAKMGMKFIGVEKNQSYFSIASSRLKPYMEQTTLTEVFQ